MDLLLWLCVGIVGGVAARRLIPKMEMNNSIFAIFIAIVGSIFGGFAAALIGFESSVVISSIIALAGSLTVLFFYKQYLTDTAQ